MKLTIIYVPCVSEEEALGIAEKLIDAKLIACANVHKSMSMYSWEGKLEQQPEFILVAKTTPGKLEAAKEKILKLHSYDVPALLTWEADSLNEKYDEWVSEQTN